MKHHSLLRLLLLILLLFGQLDDQQKLHQHIQSYAQPFSSKASSSPFLIVIIAEYTGCENVAENKRLNSRRPVWRKRYIIPPLKLPILDYEGGQPTLTQLTVTNNFSFDMKKHKVQTA
nr:MAG TPA_asm: hypothetical protein [Caudoviricetes sp.]